MKCIDCEEKNSVFFLDPRVPPLSEHACLCKECAEAAYEEAVEALYEERNELFSDASEAGLDLSLVRGYLHE